MKKYVTLFGFAVLLAFAVPQSPAQAASFAPAATKHAAQSGIVKVHRRWRRGRPRFYFSYGYYPRYSYYPSYRYYPRYRHFRKCRWLKRKARRTGSRYWWRRYRNCRWG